jgi:hypothetical protein
VQVRSKGLGRPVRPSRTGDGACGKPYQPGRDDRLALPGGFTHSQTGPAGRSGASARANTARLLALSDYFAGDAHPFPVAALVGIGVKRFAMLAVVLGRVGDPAVQESDVTDDAHLDILEGQIGEGARLGDEIQEFPPAVRGRSAA